MKENGINPFFFLRRREILTAPPNIPPFYSAALQPPILREASPMRKGGIMPEVRRLDDYPNILIVGGRSIRQFDGDYREKLRDYLHGLDRDESPVRRGTHDFWITYPYPSLFGHGANHSWEDMDISPRPLRGIVEMTEVPVRQFPDAYRESLRDELHTLLQEIGHHWLVPSQLRFRVGNRLVSAPNVHDLVTRINQGAYPDLPLLLGRTNNHWSVFTLAHDSPLDGQSYRKLEARDGLATWEATRLNHASIEVSDDDSGVDELRLKSSFNDAELYLMGILSANEQYRTSDIPGSIQWLEPRIASGYDYQVGLFVTFGNGDYYTFGFYRSPDVLAATRTSGSTVEVQLPSSYRPFTSPGMVLRIVRRGNHYYFQAKQDTPYDDLEHTQVHGIFDDLSSLPEPTAGNDWRDFRTVAHWERSDAPLGIGLIVRRWSASFLVEGRFFNLELKKGDGAGSQGWNLNSIPREVRTVPNYSTIPAEILHLHRVSGASRRVVNHRMFLTAPFSTNAASQPDGFKHYPHFDIRKDDDRSVKLLIKPEAGNFAFGSSVRVARVIPTPWAGGDIQGRTMWGEAKSMLASQLRIPAGWEAKRTPPSNDRYRCAFIIVANDADTVPEDVVRDLDLVRRYWDQGFYAATRRNRRSLSKL